tara:strand:+ start:19 stop:249 length:231 start_codon:yes stop_codon:yes gene_type:complete
MYEQREKKSYHYNYSVVVLDDDDNDIDSWEGQLTVESTKANPYEDFWKLASEMRKTYLKNNPTHKYTIETTGWYQL